MAEMRDVVVIGSGHNGLVAAAYLAKAGLDVEVFERNAVAGGAVASEELTEPGFIHDTFATSHTLFKLSRANEELGRELEAFGLQYCETPIATTANVGRDGAAVVAYRDAEKTVGDFDPRDRAAYFAELESFGATIETVGQIFGTELYSAEAAKLAVKLGRQLGRRHGLAFTADVLSSARAWLESRFVGREIGDLYAPWALHTGMSPDGVGSGFQLKTLAGAMHAVGLPVVQGGGNNFVQAFERLISTRGGRVTTGVEVDQIVTRGGTAVGVVAGGTEVRARRAVIANTTPTQLYGRLLTNGAAPADAVKQGLRFRYNPRGGMQIHVALRAPLRWRESRLDAVPVVHLSDGIGEVGLACAQAVAGLLPERPTVVVGQTSVVDPSRTPEGAAMLWIQLMQAPYAPTGDVAGQIDTGDGSWTPELTSAFTERVLSLLEPHVENWSEVRPSTTSLSPVELERRNPNLVRGDISAGDTEVGQSYLWRPLPGYGGHSTPIRNLYQCGASTYPGAGLNAASGRIVAQQIIGGERRVARGMKSVRALRERVA